MDLVLWSIIAWVLLPAFAATGAWEWNQPRRGSGRWNQWYSQKAQLPLPQELREPLLRRVHAQERWAFRGGAVGWALGALILLLTGRTHDMGTLVLTTLILGTLLGGVASILLSDHQLSQDAPRYARAQAVELSGYVPRGELLSLRMAPAAAALLAAGAVVILQLTPADLPGSTIWTEAMLVTWVLAGLTVMSWAGSELASRHVLGRPQHAHSELELAWDDHCRSQALRQVIGLPLACCFFTGIAALGAVVLQITPPEVRQGAEMPTLWAGVAVLLLVLVCLGAVLTPLVRLIGDRHQYVARTLWKDHHFPPVETLTAEAGPGGTPGAAPDQRP